MVQTYACQHVESPRTQSCHHPSQGSRSEVERLRREAAATTSATSFTEASLRRELEVLQAALERAQHSTAYGYGDHDSHAERELASARSEVVRLQSDARRLQVRCRVVVSCTARREDRQREAGGARRRGNMLDSWAVGCRERNYAMLR